MAFLPLDLLRRWQRRRAMGSLRELRKLRQVLEVGIDSYRYVNGLPTVFDKGVAVDEEEPLQSPIPYQAGNALRPGDFQVAYVIEELAREQNIPIRATTDLEALAVSRGWISPVGEILVWPESLKPEM